MQGLVTAFSDPVDECARVRTLRQLFGQESSRDGSWVDTGTGLRRIDVRSTLQWIVEWSKHFGITRVADITLLDRIGIPVAIAIRPCAKSISVSQGKGLTIESAMVSALMESIEVWHSENLPDPEISTGETTPPKRTMQIEIGENANEHTQNPSKRWYRALDGISLCDVWVPESLLSMDTVGRPRAEFGFTPTTNGLASGNCIEEAVCHSAFEIIERHAFSLWLDADSVFRSRTSIDLEEVDGPNAALLSKIKEAGLDINVFDLSAFSLGLPCFVAEIYGDADFLTSRPYTGRGLHPSADVALTRAITESAQSRLSMISGSREDNFDEDYYLSGVAQVACSSYPPARLDPALVAAWKCHPLDFIRSRLLEHGYNEWVIFNHSRPHLGIPVVHGFIPGMRHKIV
jgi:YcaO-like protein with predicted kinase domain